MHENGKRHDRDPMLSVELQGLHEQMCKAVATVAPRVMAGAPRGMLDRVGRVLGKRLGGGVDRDALREGIKQPLERYGALLGSLPLADREKARADLRALSRQYNKPQEEAVFLLLEELIDEQLAIATKIYAAAHATLRAEEARAERVEMIPDSVEYLAQKKARGEAFTLDNLKFIYGIGYGAHAHKNDVAIQKLRAERADPEADIPLVFGCKESQIAREPAKIDKNTIVYVGPIFNFSEVLKKFPNLEHIYISFPERKIRRDQVTIDGTPANEMETLINQKGFKVYSHSRKMMDKIPLREGSEKIDLVCLTVGDLGFTKSATLKEICDKAKEFGLDVCPPEVGPHYRLAYDNQPMNEYLTVATETISDSDGCPDVFSLNHGEDGVWLVSGWAYPVIAWDPVDGFVFRLRK